MDLISSAAAIISVDGASPATFNTEDDPTRTSLSADVPPGDYTATVKDGWRLERLDSGIPTLVTATLTSDNPVAFTVMAELRTTVPLVFRVDGNSVDLGAGYDIVIGIDEAIPSPGDAYQAIDAPSPRNRLVFDAARQALYAVNKTDQEIERYALSSGQWAALPPAVIPDLTDVAITPDGSKLVVLDGGHVNDIDLAAGTFTVSSPLQVCRRTVSVRAIMSTSSRQRRALTSATCSPASPARHTAVYQSSPSTFAAARRRAYCASLGDHVALGRVVERLDGTAKMLLMRFSLNSFSTRSARSCAITATSISSSGVSLKRSSRCSA